MYSQLMQATQGAGATGAGSTGAYADQTSPYETSNAPYDSSNLPAFSQEPGFDEYGTGASGATGAGVTGAEEPGSTTDVLSQVQDALMYVLENEPDHANKITLHKIMMEVQILISKMEGEGNSAHKVSQRQVPPSEDQLAALQGGMGGQ